MLQFSYVCKPCLLLDGFILFNLGLTPSQRNNVEIQRLIELLQTVILSDCASSTVCSYAGAANRWIDWCKLYSFSPLQANPTAVALYLTSLSDRGLSRSSVLGAAYGIAWLHKKVGCPNPVDNPFVAQTLAGLKRLLAGPSKKKRPIEAHHVRSLIRSYGHRRSSLPDLQMVSLITLGFCAFLRWSELRNLRACDLSFCPSHVSVFLHRRKNDQFRQGSVIKVARLASSSCPVKLLELFLVRGEHHTSQPLFCLCQKTGTGFKLRQTPLSYSRAREQFHRMISELGLVSSDFGLHSLRSGGASQAARNGISGRVWRRHGGWRSVQAADGYIEESLDNTLMVSRSLAL